MDKLFEVLEDDLPDFEEPPPPPLSEYYYQRRREGTLWRDDGKDFLQIDFETLQDRIGERSPMEKGLMIAACITVWIGVGWLQSRISHKVTKLVCSHS